MAAYNVYALLFCIAVTFERKLGDTMRKRIAESFSGGPEPTQLTDLPSRVYACI